MGQPMKMNCRNLFSIKLFIIEPFPSAEILSKLKLQRKQNTFCSKLPEYCWRRYCFWRSFLHFILQIEFFDWLKLCESLSLKRKPKHQGPEIQSYLHDGSFDWNTDVG